MAGLFSVMREGGQLICVGYVYNFPSERLSGGVRSPRQLGGGGVDQSLRRAAMKDLAAARLG